MNIERLELLKKALQEEELKEQIQTFDMETWGTFNLEPDNLEECEEEVSKIAHKESCFFTDIDDCRIIPPNACATAACALGTAALYPPLFDQGLRLITNTRLLKHKLHLGCTVYYEGHTETDAGAKFFDLSYDEARFLFNPAYYVDENHLAIDEPIMEYPNDITRDVVINRIDALINGYDVGEREYIQ